MMEELVGGWRGCSPGDYCITNQEHVPQSIASYVIASTGHAKLWHNVKILVYFSFFIYIYFARLYNFPGLSKNRPQLDDGRRAQPVVARTVRLLSFMKPFAAIQVDVFIGSSCYLQGL